MRMKNENETYKDYLINVQIEEYEKEFDLSEFTQEQKRELVQILKKEENCYRNRSLGDRKPSITQSIHLFKKLIEAGYAVRALPYDNFLVGSSSIRPVRHRYENRFNEEEFLQDVRSNSILAMSKLLYVSVIHVPSVSNGTVSSYTFV